ncbi:hypothetical protein PM082_021772 [Marasmius tenuissimus]|nr:hypothetical protein PM082_021772 [Marasmius tenuissimus]
MSDGSKWQSQSKDVTIWERRGFEVGRVRPDRIISYQLGAQPRFGLAALSLDYNHHDPIFDNNSSKFSWPDGLEVEGAGQITRFRATFLVSNLDRKNGARTDSIRSQPVSAMRA